MNLIPVTHIKYDISGHHGEEIPSLLNAFLLMTQEPERGSKEALEPFLIFQPYLFPLHQYGPQASDTQWLVFFHCPSSKRPLGLYTLMSTSSGDLAFILQKKTSHSLRHLYATLLLEGGVSLSTLSLNICMISSLILQGRLLGMSLGDLGPPTPCLGRAWNAL